MNVKKKRGLSPVIATLLLIALALVLALLIFIWARSFVKERAQKFGEAVELSCERIEFVAEVKIDGTVYVNNIGNVPLHGVELKQREDGTIKSLGSGIFEEGGLPVGASKSISVPSPAADSEIVVVPIILGETGDYKKQYVCDERFGEVVEVV